MKKAILAGVTSGFFAFMLAGCSIAAAPTAIPTISLNPAAAAKSATISASGRVVPAISQSLSFPIIGSVSEVRIQAGDAVKKGQLLVRLDSTLLDARVKVAEADLHAAQAQNAIVRQGTQDNLRWDAAQAEEDRAAALLEAAQINASESSLLSPMDGTIVSVSIAEGETVVPGQVILVVADLTKMNFETSDLGEKDVARLEIGQKAEIRLSALSGKWSGTISDIARSASKIGGDVVYTVKIAFLELPQGLLWGMTGTVQIATVK